MVKHVNGVVVEEQSCRDLALLAGDIAKQLRDTQGKAVVVCEQPTVLLSLVRKRWLRTMRLLMRERASTIDAMKILRLNQEIVWMQGRMFSSKASPQALEYFEASAIFATVEQLLQWAPECQVMYVTCPIEKKELYFMTGWMRKDGLVVLYNLKVK